MSQKKRLKVYEVIWRKRHFQQGLLVYCSYPEFVTIAPNSAVAIDTPYGWLYLEPAWDEHRQEWFAAAADRSLRGAALVILRTLREHHSRFLT